MSQAIFVSVHTEPKNTKNTFQLTSQT